MGSKLKARIVNPNKDWPLFFSLYVYAAPFVSKWKKKNHSDDLYWPRYEQALKMYLSSRDPDKLVARRYADLMESSRIFLEIKEHGDEHIATQLALIRVYVELGKNEKALDECNDLIKRISEDQKIQMTRPCLAPLESEEQRTVTDWNTWLKAALDCTMQSITAAANKNSQWSQPVKSSDRYSKSYLTTLDPSQIEWIGDRFLDLNIRTFKFQEKYYKAVLPQAKKHIEFLFTNGVFERLIDKKYIPEMQLSNICISGFPMILEQESESFNIPSDKWNPLMLRDAALTYIDASLLLIKYGLNFIDGHTKNIVFQNNSIPKWCDIGSIIKHDNRFGLFHITQFIEYFLHPLMLRAKSNNFKKISRYYTTVGCENQEFAEIYGKNINISNNRKATLENLRNLISDMNFQWEKTIWSGYHGNFLEENTGIYGKKNGDDSSLRENLITRLIQSIKPRKVVDIGANAGYFSILAARSGAEVLAIEPDEVAASRCYLNFRKCNTLKVKVAIGDISYTVDPVPDLVLALALTHHLFFTHGYRLDISAKLLAKHTDDVLITEFMPNGFGGSRPNPDPLPENYRLEIFLDELSRHFESIEVIDPQKPENGSHRILIVARNKFKTKKL